MGSLSTVKSTMPFHMYRAWREDEESHWFGIRVEFQEDHWVATCQEVNEEGEPLPGTSPIAPRFYGVTAEQAQRRMVQALENSFDEVIHEAGRREHRC